MGLLNIYYFVQAFNTVTAVFLNFFLVFLVCRYSNNKIGKYRYLIISFALFEAAYALVVFLGMPINFLADRSWLIFTHENFLGSYLSAFGPALYCSMYEIWMGFVVIHFLYRYVVMCRPKVANYISFNHWVKVCLLGVWICFVAITFACGLFFCTRLTMSEHMYHLIQSDFGIKDADNVSYILLRKRDPLNNTLSFAGTASILNHFLIVSISAVIIVFCGLRVWAAIEKIKGDSQFLRDHSVQLQMFMTLVIQTLVPVLFCHIPSLIYLSFPFWETDFSFGEWSLCFSILTSISKWIDPIIVMVCIREYRHALGRICGGGYVKAPVQNCGSTDNQQSVNFSSLHQHVETHHL